MDDRHLPLDKDRSVVTVGCGQCNDGLLNVLVAVVELVDCCGCFGLDAANVECSD